MKEVNQFQITLIADDEEFKTVRIYNEYYDNYLISNYGRVYSLHCNRFIYQKIDTHGYISYKLYFKGKEKYISGQRLVSFSFVSNPKPDKYNIVNHIDENPSNNKWTNLEWCDDKWNLNWATAQKRRAAKRSKKVLQYDLDNNFIAEYKSLPELYSKTGYWPAKMCKVCRNQELYHGYYWKYA